MNPGSERLYSLKIVKHWWEKFKTTQTECKGILYLCIGENIFMSCTYILEDLILLKYLCFPKWSTDLMQILSKSQCNFFLQK